MPQAEAACIEQRVGQEQGNHMIRKLILPALTVALLGGCVTGYSYRQGSGDYYYGAPGVEYRYYPTYPYGAYGYYGPYRYADPYAYRSYPYGYRSGYGYPYGYPYSNYYYYRRQVPQHPPADPTPDGISSPWRRLDEARRRKQGGTPPPLDPWVDAAPDDDKASWRRLEQVRRRQQEYTPPPPAAPRPSVDTDPAPSPRSSLGGRVRRTQERALDREEAP